MKEFTKYINYSDIEKRISNYWDDNSFWDNNLNSNKKPFCIMMPPPNVTGNLHLGHALDNVLVDIFCRYKRMKGYDVLWQPGTDHASIATQLMVEKNLSKRGINPKTLNKEDLLKEAWAWKEDKRSIIIKQLKALGVTPVWKREKFTLDSDLSKAVIKVFVKLYEDGLIYQSECLVNWCPKQQTSVSDLEVNNREEIGKFYYLKYKCDDGSFINVATTRPETLFGDKAIAIHPENKKLNNFIGKFAVIPLTDIKIPIIADFHADPLKGTGAVKITPAHDFDDFEVAKRHNLKPLCILTKDAKLNDNVPLKYRNLDRYEARKIIIEDLEKGGFLSKIEDKNMNVPYSERGGVVIEPYLTKQWFVDTKKLAEKAILAVGNGEIKFLPDHRVNLFMSWMNGIRPWLISRQLWWGHRIPVWYDKDGNIYVAENEEQALIKSNGKELQQDEDVLDTWFSSALWPFATLGWPEQTEELKRYYPTDLLCTGVDIIYFWVARMIMMSLYTIDKVPFHVVNLHGLIRDSKGQKMSKTKGNGVDIFDVINKFGVDAFRYWLASVPVGMDVNYSETDVKQGNKMLNKLWNATKFVIGNLSDFEINKINYDDRLIEDKWILSELNKTIKIVCEHLDRYDNFNARFYIDTFFYDVFCDNYLEFVKDRLWNEEKYPYISILSAKQTLFEVLRAIIGLYAPFIPFVTEEIWQNFYKDFEDELTLHLTKYPSFDNKYIIDNKEINIALSILKKIRTLRTERKINNGAKLENLTINAVLSEEICNFIKTASRTNFISVNVNSDIDFKVSEL